MLQCLAASREKGGEGREVTRALASAVCKAKMQKMLLYFKGNCLVLDCAHYCNHSVQFYLNFLLNLLHFILKLCVVG